MTRFATPLFMLVTHYAGAVSASSLAASPASCDDFLKRACSKQEEGYFAKGMKLLNVHPTNFASSCDSFLKRACNSQEKLGFAQGAKAQWALASK